MRRLRYTVNIPSAEVVFKRSTMKNAGGEQFLDLSFHSILSDLIDVITATVRLEQLKVVQGISRSEPSLHQLG